MRTHAIEVLERREEYTRKQRLRIKIGSWNVAALNRTQDELSKWFTSSQGKNTEAEAIGLYVLGLQEIVDVSSPTETFRPYVDNTVATCWKENAAKALPEGYSLVAEQQLVGLLLLIYASPSLFPSISHVSTANVGTGLLGYMGNKGAVAARFLLGDVTRLAFVNVHMSAGADTTSLERRNWDSAQITTRTKFSPITGVTTDIYGTAEVLDDQDYVFWFGDLNYRLQGMSGEDVRRLLDIHSTSRSPTGGQNGRNKSFSKISSFPLTVIDSNTLSNDDGSLKQLEKDSSYSAGETENETNPSIQILSSDTLSYNGNIQDPASLRTTLASLLPHDELLLQQRNGKAFHDGWAEGPIIFLPTYKYDVGSVDSFDSSEKKRCPSWCDRILYRTRARKQKADVDSNEQRKASLKDQDMEANGLAAAAEDELSLFDYDPQVDGENADEQHKDRSEEVGSHEETSTDSITLERYDSYQHITESDHKPLEAVFSINYDTFVPELRAQISQEISREMDRIENEGRPTITFVVEPLSVDGVTSSKTKEDASATLIDFGDVRYAEPKSRNMTIANTGQVPASISFRSESVPSSSEPYAALPPWLTIDIEVQEASNSGSSEVKENSCTLDPGDTCAVRLTVSVDDMDLVKQLNSSAEDLDRIIFLRVDDGSDSFITVKGHWLWSCFAQSISTLIRIPEGGIRQLQLKHEQNHGQNANAVDEVKWSSPRELFKLTKGVEDLAVRTIADWNMRDLKDPMLLPPWQQVAGWPFTYDSHDSESSRPTATTADADDTNENQNTATTSPPSSSSKQHLRLAIYEALDTDQSLNETTLKDHPATLTTKTEVMAETLLLFLRSLVDGVITVPIWSDLEPVLIADETASKSKASSKSIQQKQQKTQSSAENKRSAILEVLGSDSSVHSVSFVLVTSMLSRIIVELSPGDSSTTTTTTTNADITTSESVFTQIPISTAEVKAKAGLRANDKSAYSSAPAEVTGSLVMKDSLSERKLAELFANVMVRDSSRSSSLSLSSSPALEMGAKEDKKKKDKERKNTTAADAAARERKIRLVEVFLA